MTGNIGNMSRAVFLDRDGVVNEDGGYIYKREDFRFLNGIFDFCRAARARGYLLFIITNQAGIARGYFTEEDYRALTEWMLDKFAEQGIQIKKVYHCPYHPEHGVGRYKKDSFDRKPNPGMIFRAQREFNINLWSSVLIGDKDSDINAGRAAGIGSLILLRGIYAFTPADDVTLCETLEDAAAGLD